MNQPFSERIYQVYPRSFHEARRNGGGAPWLGIGNLRGITEKIPYIKGLHMDAVWISPFFRTPNGKASDGGYAISNYREIDPVFGTEEDFKALLEAAHQSGPGERRLKVYIDFVPCHTSDEHVWFQASRDPNHPDHEKYKDYYVWHPGVKGDDGLMYPPNNWRNCFDNGSAWEWDDKRQAFYLRHFSRHQPALNLGLTKVQDAVLAEMEFWLKMGIDGMRLDALPFAAVHAASGEADPYLGKNNPETGPSWNQQYFQHSICQPGVVLFTRRIAELFEKYGATSLAEAIAGKNGGGDSVAEAGQYIREGGLTTAYTDLGIGTFWWYPSADTVKEMITGMMKHSPDGRFTMNMSNHDFRRVASRVTEGMPQELHPIIIRQIMMLGLSLPGGYCMYQGEELGLYDARIGEDIPWNRIQDGVDARTRDGSRTPMVWDPSLPNAGFSEAAEAELYLPIAPSHLPRSVATQEAENRSMLRFTRAALAEWDHNPALKHGSLRLLDTSPPLVAFVRETDDQAVLCFFNMSGQELYVRPSDILDKATLKKCGITKTDQEVKLYAHGFERFGVREVAKDIATATKPQGTPVPEAPRDIMSVFGADVLLWDHFGESSRIPGFETSYGAGKTVISPETYNDLSHALTAETSSMGGSTAITLWTLKEILGNDAHVAMMTVLPGHECGQELKHRMEQGGMHLITPPWPAAIPAEGASSHVIRRSDGSYSVLTTRGRVYDAMKEALNRHGDHDLIERSIAQSDVVILPGALTQRFGQTFTDIFLHYRWRYKKEMVLTLPVHADITGEDKAIFRGLIASANVVVGSDREFARLYNLADTRPIPEQDIQTIIKTVQAEFRRHVLEENNMPLRKEQVAFIKRGPLPALLITADHVIEVPVVAHAEGAGVNPVGDGTASNAGFIAGYLKGLEHEQSAKLAMEMATAKRCQTTPEAHLTNPRATLADIQERIPLEVFDTTLVRSAAPEAPRRAVSC